MGYQPHAGKPDPAWHRPKTKVLTGQWSFAFDDGDAGLSRRWWDPDHELPLAIQVPFCFQSELSGVAESGFHDVVWYGLRFTVPPVLTRNAYQPRVFLKFGAVDYEATVFLNGHHLGSHEGGFSPFEFDVTDWLSPDGENALKVRVFDPSEDRTIPRGKQYWKPEPEGIYYPRVTGIWQPVWLEGRGPAWLERAWITPRLDPPGARVRVEVTGKVTPRTTLEAGFYFGKKMVAAASFPVPRAGGDVEFEVDLAEFVAKREETPTGALWDVGRGNLFDVVFTLRDDRQELDEVQSYFGLREVRVADGQIWLNRRPVFLKMLLHQYYWPDGLYTPPSEEDFKRDVALMTSTGFNGARLHQVVPDPRFLRACDEAGFLIWLEMANAHEYSHKAGVRLQAQWTDVVRRDHNHPCVVAWVPVNESWGFPNLRGDPQQRSLLRGLYHLTKAMDPSRPVVDNDGWEHCATDLATYHQYVDPSFLEQVFPAQLEEFEGEDLNHLPGGRPLFVGSARLEGQPLVVSEMGGFGMDLDDPARAPNRSSAWGYGGLKRTADELLDAYERSARELAKRTWIAGFCYTEFCDVFQEKNGLFTFDRRPKVAPNRLRAVNESF
ncbi:MAG: glycoside hydrolase family 2 TIM barrel-domain containing protein [Promethearchaeota archaeon]